MGDLPIIDWDTAIKMAGNHKDVAENMLHLLMQELVTETTTIKNLHKEKNYKEMLKHVHKLHGALCYSGLPRIKNLIARLETNLKNHIMDDSPYLLEQLDSEVSLLLEHYACHHS